MAATLPRRVFQVSGPRRSGAICLTFDDGPHPIHTPRVLDVLKEHHARATFFVVGQNVERYPDIVRRAVEEGHAIGHHTYHHARPERVSSRQLLDELRATDELLAGIVGVRPRMFRPPWGRLTVAKLVRLILGGRSIVLWSSDPKDCQRRTATEVVEWFAEHPVGAGDIVLMHDDQPHVTDVLRALVGEVRSRGIGLATPIDWATPTPLAGGGAYPACSGNRRVRAFG